MQKYRQIKRLAAAIIFLFFSVSLAYSDEVFLKSGKRVRGKIIEETNSFLRLDVGSGVQLRYYFDEIKKIQRDVPEPGNKLFELKAVPIMPAPRQESGNLTSQSENWKTIEKVINNYLSLVTKPLPLDPNLRKQVFERLAAVEDLNSMSSFLLFRQTVEKAQSKGSGKQAGVAAIREKFLESQIAQFQASYPVGEGLDNKSFKTVDIELSGNQAQAIATVSYKAGFLRFKLHKTNSVWSIYSTE